MARSTLPRPTDAELEILRVLWDLGPSTVREVADQLGKTRDVGYTTVLKLLQIMFEKGRVLRDESKRSHVYWAKDRKETTQRQLVSDLIARAFEGAREKLILQALSTKRASKEELAEIRRMLDELEGGAS